MFLSLSSTARNSMTGNKVFIDSNIFIYLLEKKSSKKLKVTSLLQPDFYISTQVVAENISVCLRKLKTPKKIAFQHGLGLLKQFNLLTIDESTLLSSFEVSTKYQLSFWDSLIIATALQHQCTILYSEDMQDGLIIEKKLTIKNPFK